MGAEQSVTQGPFRKRSRSLDRHDGTLSPPLSIASDVDAPYMSSTINRPIGDSPKRQSAILSRARGAKDLVNLRAVKADRRRVSQFPEEITVVNLSVDPGSVRNEVAKEIKRFEDIPQFLPILRGALKGSLFGRSKSRDDLACMEKIDSRPMLSMARTCLEFMTHNALNTGSEQSRVMSKVRDVAGRTEALLSTSSERQRKYSKIAEGLSHVSEISRVLRKCHNCLGEVISLLQTLNDLLPEDERLEPFDWISSGEDHA